MAHGPLVFVPFMSYVVRCKVENFSTSDIPSNARFHKMIRFVISCFSL